MREIHSVGPHTRELIVVPHACPPLDEVGIMLMGTSDARAGFRFVRRAPVMTQVLVTVSGRGRVWVDGQWRTCGPGQAYVTPPHVPNAYEALPKGRWNICWVIYQPNHPGCPVTAALDAPVLRPVQAQPLHAAIANLHRESFGLALPALQRAWLEVIQLHLRRELRIGADPFPLRTLWESVDADLAHPWTLPELADRAAMSDEHLRRHCQHHLGHSPMNYLRRLRMQRAMALLLNTHMKIEQVAKSVGYADRFAFSHAFARVAGESPARFRSAAHEQRRRGIGDLIARGGGRDGERAPAARDQCISAATTPTPPR